MIKLNKVNARCNIADRSSSLALCGYISIIDKVLLYPALTLISANVLGFKITFPPLHSPQLIFIFLLNIWKTSVQSLVRGKEVKVALLVIEWDERIMICDSARDSRELLNSEIY